MAYINVCINELKISNNFALKNVHFEIQKGSICSFIGNNGAGKTSLLNVLVKNHKIAKQYVFIDGLDLSKLTYKELSKYIAYVPQMNQIYPELCVYDFVATGRLPHLNFLGLMKKEDRDIIEETFNQLNIQHLKNHKIGALSGGQFQKIVIANALVQQAPIIILDEPLNYLDLKASDDICQLILDLKNVYQKTIIVVMHDLEIAANLSDQVVLFWNGTTPLKGKPIDVINNQNIKTYFSTSRDVIIDGNKIKIM